MTQPLPPGFIPKKPLTLTALERKTVLVDDTLVAHELNIPIKLIDRNAIRPNRGPMFLIPG